MSCRWKPCARYSLAFAHGRCFVIDSPGGAGRGGEAVARAKLCARQCLAQGAVSLLHVVSSGSAAASGAASGAVLGGNLNTDANGVVILQRLTGQKRHDVIQSPNRKRTKLPEAGEEEGTGDGAEDGAGSGSASFIPYAAVVRHTMGHCKSCGVSVADCTCGHGSAADPFVID